MNKYCVVISRTIHLRGDEEIHCNIAVEQKVKELFIYHLVQVDGFCKQYEDLLLTFFEFCL